MLRFTFNFRGADIRFKLELTHVLQLLFAVSLHQSVQLGFLSVQHLLERLFLQ